MDEFIDEVLQCPVTGGALRAMNDDEIAQANLRQANGGLRRRDGSPVELQLAAGLATADGGLGYRIDDGRLALLEDLAIVLGDDERDREPARAFTTEKESVQAFYDELGWTMTEDDVFEDTVRFVDRRPEIEAYNRRSMIRVNQYLPPGGKYFLDVASGPVQFPEYIAYSEAFDRRICVDFSSRALIGAREQVGDRGIYILGDITNLPFKDDSLDGVISLHTIYHVPRDQQPTAFRELHRVLKPGGTAVVAYTWGRTPWEELSLPRRLLLFPSRVVQRLARSLKRGDDGREHREDGLYFHAFDHRWFVGQDWQFRYEIYVGHLLTAEFMKRFIHPRLLGRRILACVARLEDRWPRFTGRFGRYPLIVITKDGGAIGGAKSGDAG